MNFEKAIVLIRNPLDASMAEFNRVFSNYDQKGHSDMELFELLNFSKLFQEADLPQWMEFHETILKDYKNKMHVVQYEKLKTNLIEEMKKILGFLGYTMTKEIEFCLKSNFDGNFKRKERPEEEIYTILENFTNSQLKYFDNVYENYLKKFQI